VEAGGQVDEDRSFNIADPNVTRGAGTGVYCFNGLNFRPRSVVATAEAFGSSGDKIATADLLDVAECEGTEQAAVRIWDASSAALQNHAFYVVFN
jgi:hypothetical protein